MSSKVTAVSYTHLDVYKRQRLDGPVTTPRNDVQYVVTEHGWANLRGMTTDQRARTLISMAAPQFREELETEARAMGLV